MTEAKKQLIEQMIAGVLNKDTKSADAAVQGLVNMRLAQQMDKAVRNEDLI